ncbi:MAG: hypothetical protein KDB27_27375, partial [Planctomycetales bacterium]|nr:hypothetical protein [Planctomycetales bacterium]
IPIPHEDEKVRRAFHPAKLGALRVRVSTCDLRIGWKSSGYADLYGTVPLETTRADAASRANIP